MIKVENHVKLLIIGDKDIGKTSFILNYLKRDFSLVNDFNLKGVNWFRKIIPIIDSNHPDSNLIIDIWDVAGGDKFKKLLPCLTSFVNGVILTFDSNSEDSFEQLSLWTKLISNYIPRSVPWILVSLKNDLKNDLISKRTFSEVISKFILRQNVEVYLPTSAVTSMNVEKSFNKLLTLIGIIV